MRCFERNDCIGLHWLGNDACSEKYRTSIELKIKELKAELGKGPEEIPPNENNLRG